MPSVPFMPFLSGFKVEMRFTQQGQQVENVYHVHKTTALDVTDLAEIGLAFKTWFAASMPPLINDEVSLNSIEVTSLETATAPGLSYTAGLPISGTSAHPALPMNVTVVVRWDTGFRGRSYRGRTYHIGLSSDLVVDSTITLTAQTALVNAYTALLTELNSGNFKLAVASRTTNKLPRMTGLMTSVLSCSIERTIDSQRRRLPGRGR